MTSAARRSQEVPMASPGGFSLDVPAADAVTAALGSVSDSFSKAYTDFGSAGSAGSGSATWGSIDANDADGGARDVSDGWAAFTDAWGQFIDEGVGAVTKVRQAVAGAVADYRHGDAAAAASITGVLGGRDAFDLSDQHALAAPGVDFTAASETARWGQLPLAQQPPVR